MNEGEMYKSYEVAKDAAGREMTPRPVAAGLVEVDLTRESKPRTERVWQLLARGLPAWGSSVEGAYSANLEKRRLADAAAAVASRFYFESKVNGFAQRLLPAGSEDDVARMADDFIGVAFGATRIQAAELPVGATEVQLNDAEGGLVDYLYGNPPPLGSPVGAPRVFGPRPAAGSLGELFLNKFTGGFQGIISRGWAGNGANQIGDSTVKDLLFGITREQMHVLRSRVRAGNPGESLVWEKDGPLAVYKAGIPERAAEAVRPDGTGADEEDTAGKLAKKEETEALSALRNAEIRGGWLGNEDGRVQKYVEGLGVPADAVGRARVAWLSARQAIVKDLSSASPAAASAADKLARTIDGAEVLENFSRPEVADTWLLIAGLCGIKVEGFDRFPPGSIPGITPGWEINRDITYEEVLGTVWMDRHGFTERNGFGRFRNATEGGNKTLLTIDERDMGRFKSVLAAWIADRVGVGWDREAGEWERIPTDRVLKEMEELSLNPKIADSRSAAYAEILYDGIVPWCAEWGKGQSHNMNAGVRYAVMHSRERALRVAAMNDEKTAGLYFRFLREQGFVRDCKQSRATMVEMIARMPVSDRRVAEQILELIPEDLYIPYVFRIQGAKRKIGDRDATIFDLLRDWKLNNRPLTSDDFAPGMKVPEGNRMAAVGQLWDECFNPGKEAKWKDVIMNAENVGWADNKTGESFRGVLQRTVNGLGWFKDVGSADPNVRDRILQEKIQKLALQMMVAMIGLQEVPGIHLKADKLDIELFLTGLDGLAVTRQADDKVPGLDIPIVTAEMAGKLRDWAGEIQDRYKLEMANDFFRIGSKGGMDKVPRLCILAIAHGEDWAQKAAHTLEGLQGQWRNSGDGNRKTGWSRLSALGRLKTGK